MNDNVCVNYLITHLRVEEVDPMLLPTQLVDEVDVKHTLPVCIGLPKPDLSSSKDAQRGKEEERQRGSPMHASLNTREPDARITQHKGARCTHQSTQGRSLTSV
eukprot:GHVU01139145.1.p2 GENE.GHVU01139145.1~~GHVU01139145.1.p2  ORF type:complete len:104 (-),score=10.00 GHVU01139145.1:383-694(-)